MERNAVRRRLDGHDLETDKIRCCSSDDWPKPTTTSRSGTNKGVDWVEASVARSMAGIALLHELNRAAGLSAGTAPLRSA
jgi:hypothetical protein